jgi:hypothetical protein
MKQRGALYIFMPDIELCSIPKCLGQVARTNKWILTNAQRAGVVYEALLRAGLFEAVLHGTRSPEPRVILEHARSAASVMWMLMEAGILDPV